MYERVSGVGRWAIWTLGLGLAVAGCGAATKPAPPVAPNVRATPAQVDSVIDQAPNPARARPGFKLPPSAARLHGVDLWDVIVLPMIKPLTPLDGRPELRTRLDAPQYAVYALFSVDDDVMDGGLWGLYHDETGVFAQEAVGLLRAVGAPRHADVLARANRIAWPASSVPSSVAARWLALSVVGESRYGGADRQWQAADRQEQALGTIIERYVRRHPSAFFS
jgi:Domain of unknown function (DUF4375)